MESAVNDIYFVNIVPGRQHRLTYIAVDDPLCQRRIFRDTESIPTNAIALLGVINFNVCSLCEQTLKFITPRTVATLHNAPQRNIDEFRVLPECLNGTPYSL